MNSTQLLPKSSRPLFYTLISMLASVLACGFLTSAQVSAHTLASALDVVNMQATTIVRINAGGGAYTDGAGNQWSADDVSLITGNTNTKNDGTPAVDGTTEDPLYNARRWGEDFTYNIPVDNGTYTVNLHLMEPYWDVATPGGTGDRIFDVNIENAPVLDGYDLYADAGPATAIVKSFDGVVVNDGTLTIQFVLGPDGQDNAIISAIEALPAAEPERPSITLTFPSDGATNVERDTDISADLYLPNGGLNGATVNSSNVLLYPTGSPSAVVPANVNTSGGFDVIVLQPTVLLAADTSYTFQVTDGVEDDTGAALIPFTMSFTTGSDDPGGGGPVEFTSQTAASGAAYTSLTIGPDGKLYGLVNNGQIRRWDINVDGTLSNEQTINSLQTAEGGSRLSIGLVFDPAATANNLIAWVSHTTFGFGGMPDWGGKITRLSGADLQTVQDYVVGLPRSCKDHVTNGISFGPDGALYANQGSNSAMGAADGTWCNRPERELSAAVLRVDTAALAGSGSLPVDVQTSAGGTYDPLAANAPVTVYASGTRNHYDHVWHSNGYMYVPTNGSASGGNAPASVDGTTRFDGTTYDESAYGVVPALTNISKRNDYLYKIPGPGAGYSYNYYGHPNPTRGEYVLNGGNPTAGSDPAETEQYPEGVAPDPNYAGFAFDFGTSKSPNGVIEYTSSSFGGQLQGKLLVVRYSGGDDIIVLTPGPNGDIVESVDSGIDGFEGFSNPLDLVENTATGDIYVSEYGSNQITLLRPTDGPADAPDIAVDASELVWSGFVSGVRPNYSIDVTISNSGDATLTISNVSISGTDAGLFTPAPTSLTVAPGASADVTVTFDPSSTGAKTAALDISSDDPDQPVLSIPLYALASNNFEGNNEPPLAQIVQTLGYNLDVGFTTLASDGNQFPIGDEVLIDLFQKAGSGPVTLVPVARYSPAFAVPFGWFEPTGGNPALNTVGTLSELGTNADPHHQMLYPPLTGGSTDFEPAVLTFDPGNGPFGLFAQSPGATGYTQDAINAPTNSGSQHRTRIYPLADRAGNPVPNSYLVAFEEAHNHDHNDYVFVVSNVVPGDDALVGSITVVKQATPEGEQAFDFQLTGPDSAVQEFTLTDGAGTTNDFSAQYNMQPADAPVPPGYTADTGAAYGVQPNGETYGWLTTAGDTPINSAEATRDRNRSGIPQELDTFNHMERGDCCTGGFEEEIYWQHALPNGTYEVTMAHGDQPGGDGYDSLHQVDVEGTLAPATPFQATAGQEFLIQTVTVEVTDGTLTIRPTAAGTNTKLNYVQIQGVSTTAPNGITFDDLPVGSYTVSELPVAGWALTDLACADPDDGSTVDLGNATATIDLDLNESITCTFSNSQATNSAPSIDPIGDQASAEGDTISLGVNATDPDSGDTLTYGASGLPAGLSIDPNSGLISGVIAAGAAAGSPYSVEVTVTDDGAPVLSDMASFQWSVSDDSAVAIALVPETVNAALGQSFDVVIEVRADQQQVDGASAYLNFDPAVMQVESITQGSTYPTLLQNEFDNGTGQVNFAAGTLDVPNAPSGTFTLATVTFQALAESAGTSISFNFGGARQTDATYSGASVLGTTLDATVVVAPGATLNGTVTLQGRPAAPNALLSVPLTVDLYAPGSDTPAYAFTPTTDDSGSFSVGGIAPGTYEVAVKLSHALQVVETVTLATGSNSVDFGTLLEGDANDDNSVELLDFSILAGAFGAQTGDAAYNAQADFNGNGTVDLNDFSLLATNFGLTGETVSGSAGAALRSLELTPAGGVTLSATASTDEAAAGEEVVVTLAVDTNGQPVDAAGAALTFDPDVVEVVAMAPGDALDQVLASSFDNDAGTLRHAAGRLEGTLPTGRFTLATVTLRMVSNAGNGRLRFVEGTAAYHGGQPLLERVADAYVLPLQNPIYLPISMQ